MPKLKIFIAIVILLFTSAGATAQTSNTIQTSSSSNNIALEKNQSLTITVGQNQSLSSIMIDQGLHPSRDLIELISKYNNLTATSTLHPGDVVKIPVKLLKTPDDTSCISEVCFEVTSESESATESTQGKNPFNPHSGVSPETLADAAPESNRTKTDHTKTNRDSLNRTESIQTVLASTESQPDLTLESIATSIHFAKQQTVATNKAEEPEASETITASVVGNSSRKPQPAPENSEPENFNEPDPSPPVPRSVAPSAPGLFEVDEDAAARALERSLVRINALLLRSGEFETSLDVAYSYDQSTSVDLVELINDDDTTTTTVGEIEDLRTSINTSLGLTFGLPGDSQVSLQLPITRTETESNILIANSEVDGSNATATGTGDISFSLAKTLFREKGRRPDVIAQLTYDSDSGDLDSSGIQLGNNHESIGFAVRATKRQDPLVFSYGISYTAQITKDNFNPGEQTNISASALLAASPSTSLLFSLNHTIIDSAELNGDSIPGSRGIDTNINLGISSVIGSRTFLSAGVIGGLTDASNDFTAYLGFSRRMRF